MRGQPIMASTSLGATNCHGNKDGYMQYEKNLSNQVQYGWVCKEKTYGKKSTVRKGSADNSGSFDRRGSSVGSAGHSANFYESQIF